MKLIQDLLENYDRKAKPTWDNNRPVNVTFSMDLYQILELNEPQQFLLLNAWIIERWHDEFLYWNPKDYAGIRQLRLPYDCIWLPDTTLYNSLVMKDEDSRRLLNAKLSTNMTRKAVLVEMLYPTIYKFSCLLNLRYFPYDLQECTMTFSSWTYDNKGIDYIPYSDSIGRSNYLENEGWYLLKSTMRREEVKYSCCPNKYTLLKLTLYLRRKPLFYLINLIIPTAIITLIAIVGFFTTSSASGMREEKVSLGITTLLSMSILMLMVSDQMPTTSTFIPLIGWFILGMIGVISLGTLASSVVIAIQKRGRLGERLTKRGVRIARLFGIISYTELPLHLRKGTREFAEAPPPSETYRKAVKLAKTMQMATGKPLENIEEEGEGGKKHKKRKFGQMLRRRKGGGGTRPANGTTTNGGMPTEKSTEPLVASMEKWTETETAAVEGDGDGSNAGKVMPRRRSTEGGVADLPVPPAPLSRGSPVWSIPSPAPPPQPKQSTVLMPIRLASLGGSEDGDTSQASELVTPSARMGLPQNELRQAVGLFNENLRLSRQLAVKEYEWLASIVERCCFIVFVILFFFLSIGINLIGYWHWDNPEAAFGSNYKFTN